MSNQIKLKRTLFGISKKPVVEYIDSISKNVEDKLFKKDSEIASLKQEIQKLIKEKEALEKEILTFNDEKGKISDVLLKAEESASSMLKEAEEKANETFEEMQKENDRLCAEYEAKLNEKKSELSSFTSEVNYLREKLQVTLEKLDEIIGTTIE